MPTRIILRAAGTSVDPTMLLNNVRRVCSSDDAASDSAVGIVAGSTKVVTAELPVVRGVSSMLGNSHWRDAGISSEDDSDAAFVSKEEKSNEAWRSSRIEESRERSDEEGEGETLLVIERMSEESRLERVGVRSESRR